MIPPGERCSLVLYIAGASARSAAAVEEVHRLCTARPGAFELLVVDVHEHANLAAEDAVAATPTLVKRWPLPSQRFVGALNAEDLAVALSLP